jgi:hypothetical protein
VEAPHVCEVTEHVNKQNKAIAIDQWLVCSCYESKRRCIQSKAQGKYLKKDIVYSFN